MTRLVARSTRNSYVLRALAAGVFALLSSAPLHGSVAAASPQSGPTNPPTIRPLSAEEALALFKGNTVVNTESKYRYYTYHSPDGRALREVEDINSGQLLPDSATISRYFIKEDKICVPSGTKANCFRFGSADTSFRIIADDGRLFGSIKILPGDPLNLATKVPQAMQATADLNLRRQSQREMNGFLNRMLHPTLNDIIESNNWRAYCMQFNMFGRVSDFYETKGNTCRPTYRYVNTDKDPYDLRR